jgi:hypothetical protein
MVIASRVLLMLLTMALVAALPVDASQVERSSAMQTVVTDPSGCCGPALEKAKPCMPVCPSGTTVSVGSGFALPVPGHASTLIPWSAQALSSLVRAPDTTPPKRSIV